MSATPTPDLERLQNFGYTHAGSAIVDALWFHPGGELLVTIGMVLTCDKIGTWKARVGVVAHPVSEQEDAKIVANTGSRLPYEIANAAFPNRFEEEKYGHA